MTLPIRKDGPRDAHRDRAREAVDRALASGGARPDPRTAMPVPRPVAPDLAGDSAD